MTNNQSGDNPSPEIQQNLLNELRVDGNLTVGDVTQQNISTQNIATQNIFIVISPDMQEKIIPQIHGVPHPIFTASRNAVVISSLCSPPVISTFKFEVIKVDAKGKEVNRCFKQAQHFIESLGNGVELEMVSIPSGKFAMGTQEELESSKDELPRHLVTVKPFFMGKYPITQAQWRAIASLPKIKHDLDPDPYCFKGDNRPIERVSWYDAEEFCDRLSQKTRRFYRLPSEAEWEYACRAQTITPFHFGATITTELANYWGQDKNTKGCFYKGTYRNEPKGIYRQEISEVDIFSANTFGLHDMHGNVWEWCADYYHNNYQEAPSDGSIWLINGNEEGRILRGGSWNSPPNICRSASRFFGNPSSSNKNIGFRVVCSFV